MKNLLHAFQAAALVLCVSLAAAGQTYPTNILENGDFHQGFACYRGDRHNGDNGWKFNVSNDKPTGSPYSAEVVCSGTGTCTWGAIASAPIPIDAGKTYELTGSYKCQTNGSGYFQIASSYDDGTTIFTQYVPFTCNNTWLTITPQIFTPTTDPVHGFPYAMDLVFYNQSSTYYLKVADLRLTWLVDGQRAVPEQEVYDVGTRRGLSVVNGPGVPIPYMTVDYIPYFALGFANVQPSDYPTVQSLGANTIFSTELPTTPTNKCFNTAEIPPLNWQDYRDWAHRNGLNLVPESMYTVRPGFDGLVNNPNGKGAEPVLASVVTEYAPHEANIGWMLADEPDIESNASFIITGAELQTLANIVGSNTTLPRLVNLFCPTHPTGPGDQACPNFHIDDYDGTGAIWGAEQYGHASPDYFTKIADAFGTFHAVSSGVLRPVWFYLNKGDQNEMFSKAYYATIKGATGILYFDWADPDPGWNFKNDAAAQANAATIFSHLSNLKDPIFYGTDASVTSSSSLKVELLSRAYNWQTYKTFIIAVNKSGTTTGPVTFAVPGLVTTQTIDVDFGMRTLYPVSTGSFIDLQGFDTQSYHVYRIK